MKIRIQASDIHLLQLKTRMPFKYGIATMTEFPLAFIRVTTEIDGVESVGISSDLLPPKWFTKDPDKAVDVEIEEMLQVIAHACRASVDLEAESAFKLWRMLLNRQSDWGNERFLPPLLIHFGTSLVERALIEAVCRAKGTTFTQALQSDLFNICLDEIHPELQSRHVQEFLPKRPLDRVIARHTVGLVDPLSKEAIAEEEQLNDGLPQSLADCIATYGLKHFKLKVSGQIESDLPRLKAIAKIIRARASKDFAVSIDGNEQFKSIDAFRDFWESLKKERGMPTFLKHLLFVEQPLHRDVALLPTVKESFQTWTKPPPIIIDESDATTESLPVALDLGYAGTSHKNCKGVFKGIANFCLLEHRRREQNQKHLIISGEDLCNQGPIALLQDLAVMAALGIQSVERNGHHYCAGLSGLNDRSSNTTATSITQARTAGPRSRFRAAPSTSNPSTAPPSALDFSSMWIPFPCMRKAESWSLRILTPKGFYSAASATPTLGLQAFHHSANAEGVEQLGCGSSIDRVFRGSPHGRFQLSTFSFQLLI